MRRSGAPSMRQSNKRKRVEDVDNAISTTAAETGDDENYNWGTSNKFEDYCSSSSDPTEKENSFYNNLLANKRIFNIVWREVTAKKHKTWKGDGILEIDVRQARAVLKDETGKYMGCASKLKVNELVEDYEMVVGGKEIQLLDEIKNADAYAQLRKQQIANRGWGEEEWQPKDETKKPKGAFTFKCSLILDRPQVPLKSNIYKQQHIVEDGHGTTLRCKDYICLLRPSELQVLLLQKAKKIFTKHEEQLRTDTNDEAIMTVLQSICDHPSLISHQTEENYFAYNLERYLPDWSEMGPFDSSKLEFVQNFLFTTVAEKQEKCLIVASDGKCLDMLSGLCDFLNLSCCRLDDGSSKNQIFETLQSFKQQDSNTKKTYVLLLQTSTNLENEVVGSVKNLIYFDVAASSLMLHSLLGKSSDASVCVYRLITCGCYEETNFQNSLNMPSPTNVALNDFMEVEVGSNAKRLHDALDCNCSCDGQNGTEDLDNDEAIGDLLNWRHFRSPFAADLLEEANLGNIGENLIFIFARKLQI